MLERPDTFEEAVLLAERAEQSLFWRRDSGRSRTFYRGSREDVRRVSQFGNSRYKGPAPMVLGTAQSAGASRGTSRTDAVCHHCGRKGHLKRDCWQLHGKPSSQPRGGATMASKPKN